MGFTLNPKRITNIQIHYKRNKLETEEQTFERNKSINNFPSRTPKLEPKAPENQLEKETIVPRKTIVYETRVDPTVIRLAGEKVKQQPFARFGLLKPKPEEIQFVSLKNTITPSL